MIRVTLFALGLLGCLHAATNGGNRFTDLDSDDPFWPDLNSPKLITPQWIGEPGVDAAIILAVDDMREAPKYGGTAKYETFLRPILDELKKQGGHAPLSIMTCSVNPEDPQLQSWITEGLSIEAHTLTHPCPLLRDGLAAAKETVDGCIDLLWRIPNNQPLAFRTPCCDSMSTPSPRVFSEILEKSTPQGHFLGIDSSVMCLLTPQDASLPRELVLDKNGKERFRKYFPMTDADFPPPAAAAATPAGPGGKPLVSPHRHFGNFGTYIEDYPYPYVINRTLWEFPCMVPSDWEAFNLHGPANPVTVADWKAALDAVVLKKGVFTFIFHPHGWIKAGQMVEFIRYAREKYGRRIKFLNFKEAGDRLTRNLLGGDPLRAAPKDGLGHWRKTVADINGDGYMDVAKNVYGPDKIRIWGPSANTWLEQPQVTAPGNPVPPSAAPSRAALLAGEPALIQGQEHAWAWRLKGAQWSPDSDAFKGVPQPAGALLFRDLQNDGSTELISSLPEGNVIYSWSKVAGQWEKLTTMMPGAARLTDAAGHDNGVRFTDLNGDGYDDLIVSNPRNYGVYIFNPVEKKGVDWKQGWSMTFREGKAGDANSLPLIVRADGTNNGVWFKHGAMWVQNEETSTLPDKVRRIPYSELLRQPGPPPLSPQDSLRAMHLKPGFTIELVATEPMVQDPVYIDWDEHGRMWVVEMGDYPFHEYQGHTYGGRVKILEDTKGTGVYDKATLFLDGLNYPNSLCRWKNGIFVSSVPEVFYEEEKDGKAGTRTTILSGFKEGNPQHLVNGFCWGLDGFYYGGNGDSDGLVMEAKSGKQFDLRGRDFRFNPATGDFNLQPGRTQYGRWRDSYGNWFGCYNSSMGWHYFMDDRYLARAPKLAVPTLRRDLNNGPDKLRVVPASVQRRFNWPDAVNTLTSGCSAIPYRDTLFGDEYAHSFFICEPANSLVHREVLEPSGISFTSHRAADEQNSEFLASEDSWSRFTMARPGPDGCLYVVDMYRLVIEHPEWIPKEITEHLDIRAGSDKGRIYRIRPNGVKPRAVPRLDKMKAAELVMAMKSPTGWVRDTAQRLLVQTGDWSAEAEAASQKVMADTSPASNPAGRVQTLWTKYLLGKLSAGDLLSAMKDPDARVRKHAVRLAESQIDDAAILRRLIALAGDPDLRVRVQVALSLGESADPAVPDALRALAKSDGSNSDMLLALLTSAPKHQAALAVEAKTWLAAFKQASKGSSAKRPVIITNRNPDRDKVVKQYAGVANLKGDPVRGHIFFKNICFYCHRLKNEGTEIGPDLGTMAGKPTDQIVESIMDPSRAVEARYLTHVVTLKSGREVIGMISEETANSITMKTAQGTEVFLRDDIKTRVSSTKSLMPDGLENLLKLQDVADVIAWIRQK